MNLKLIQQNVNKMLQKRGYSFDRKNNDVYLYKKNTQDIIIWYYGNDKLNIDAVKDFLIILDNMNARHGIIVYQGTVTSSTKKVLDHMYKHKIELFSYFEFMFDITEHMYYCPHRKLSSTEAEEIKKSFGTQLPVILKTDPIAKYFQFYKNDIIEIIRKNNSIAYRIVK